MHHLTVFSQDITPPIGHALCAGWCPPATAIGERLSAHGIVLFPADEAPIILCALDWAELSNDEYDLWRATLAQAAETTPERVALHCVHNHDAPWPDRVAQEILDKHQHPRVIMDRDWCTAILHDVAAALRCAIARPRTPVTHFSYGRAEIGQLASNRRIMGNDGKIRGVRWTRCTDPDIRNAPEGLIDPFLKTISFWNGNRKIVALHYYAVHPTSYDGTGVVTHEFVGIARERLAAEEGIPHLYFTECAGNITAGKYNDGDPASRERFAARILNAMKASEANAERLPLEQLHWSTTPVTLPWYSLKSKEELLRLIADPATTSTIKSRAALLLSYLQRQPRPISLGLLRLGTQAAILHLPGESFIEYQLFAQSLAPGVLLAVPSYGDCGPGYICKATSQEEGGYEPEDAFCGPDTEGILKAAIRALLV